MAKYSGKVGYVERMEVKPSTFKSVPYERQYYGDVIMNTRRFENGEGVIEDVKLNNKVSIVADPFAYEHFQFIKYIRWMNAVWNVTNVEVLYPRLILTIGDVYNGPVVKENNS